MAAETPAIAKLSTPFLGPPVEICIVTPDLKSTLSGLLTLGIGPFKIYHFTPETVKNQMFRGEAAEFSIDVAFAEQEGGMIWEVMQPVAGSTLMREFLEMTSGKGGIQHVAFGCREGRQEEGKGNGTGEEARREAKRRKAEFEGRGELWFCSLHDVLC